MDQLLPAKYLIVLSHDVPGAVETFLKETLRINGLHVEKGSLGDQKVLCVSAPFEIFAAKAEVIGIEKSFKHENELYLMPFKMKLLESYETSDYSSFFTAAQQTLLLRLVLQSIPVEARTLNEMGVVLKKNLAKSRKNDLLEVELLSALQNCKNRVIEEHFPLHDDSARNKLWEKFKSEPWTTPIAELQTYFGEEVTFYFAWVNHFMRSLLFPGIIGLVLYFIRPKGADVDHAKWLPGFAMMVCCWSVLFTVIWRRKQTSYAFKWDTCDFERVVEQRPEFFGDVRSSPVTGLPELYYPTWKKMFRYCISFLAATPMLMLAVKAMLLSLNLNGYIKDPDSIFYVHFLCQYAEPGAIFAQDSPYNLWIVPTLMHSLMIFILGSIYRHIAVWCTDFENHRTVEQWNNSFITKRFLFEAFDCYTPLFYIAFYRLDINSLRSELVGLFWGDEIRRLSVEVLIPLVLSFFKQRDADKKYQETKKNDSICTASNLKPTSGIDWLQAEKELGKDEYEEFDDYLEMVIQFGYVTLFASAMPLCSIISVIFLFIETKADCFKLLFLYKRPHSRRAANIGVWLRVLDMMTMLSLLTNVLLIGFSSEQLQMWFPQYYDFYENDHWIKMGSGRYVVAVVFIMEHALAVFAAVAHIFVEYESKQTRNERLRKEYLQKQIELSPLWRNSKV